MAGRGSSRSSARKHYYPSSPYDLSGPVSSRVSLYVSYTTSPYLPYGSNTHYCNCACLFTLFIAAFVLILYLLSVSIICVLHTSASCHSHTRFVNHLHCFLGSSSSRVTDFKYTLSLLLPTFSSVLFARPATVVHGFYLFRSLFLQSGPIRDPHHALSYDLVSLV